MKARDLIEFFDTLHVGGGLRVRPQYVDIEVKPYGPISWQQMRESMAGDAEVDSVAVVVTLPDLGLHRLESHPRPEYELLKRIRNQAGTLLREAAERWIYQNGGDR